MAFMKDDLSEVLREKRIKESSLRKRIDYPVAFFINNVKGGRAHVGRDQTMKFYVAGKWKDTEDIKAIMKHLTELGHVLTLDWTGHVHPEKSAEYSVEDIDGVSKCDFLVAYMPDADVCYKGAWVEIGAALALGKWVFIIGKHVTSVFLGHPKVTVFSDIDSCLTCVENIRNDKYVKW